MCAKRVLAHAQTRTHAHANIILHTNKTHIQNAHTLVCACVCAHLCVCVYSWQFCVAICGECRISTCLVCTVCAHFACVCVRVSCVFVRVRVCVCVCICVCMCVLPQLLKIKGMAINRTFVQSLAIDFGFLKFGIFGILQTWSSPGYVNILCY